MKGSRYKPIAAMATVLAIGLTGPVGRAADRAKDNDSPKPIQWRVLAPENGSELLSEESGNLEVLFSWEPVPGAQSYDFIIDGEPVQRVDVNTTTYMLESETYTWSVRAVFANGSAGPEAEAWNVTVINTRPPDGAEFFLIPENMAAIFKFIPFQTISTAFIWCFSFFCHFKINNVFIY